VRRDRACCSGRHGSFTFSTKGRQMKRVGPLAIKIGLMICVSIGAVKLGFAEEREHAATCTLSTLKGRYLFATSGMIHRDLPRKSRHKHIIRGVFAQPGPLADLAEILARNQGPRERGGAPWQTGALSSSRLTLGWLRRHRLSGQLARL
jgi:hypothetical protein